MLSFMIKFHRYHDGDSRLSKPEYVLASDFAQAHVMAQHILTGLRGADKIATYKIAIIEVQGLRAKQAEGLEMFDIS